MRKYLVGLFVIFTMLISSVSVLGNNDSVYTVKLDSTINKGSVAIVNRTIEEAQAKGASLIIVEIDTYGGLIDSAISIKNAIMSSPVKTVTFVNKKAISAGSLIALSGSEMFMANGSTIGAAEARQGTEKADEKVMSMWTSELATTAETNGKDPQIAKAMADSEIIIEGITAKGKLVTLTDKQALQYNMADYNANNIIEVCSIMKIDNANITEVKPTTSEKLSMFVTNPVVAGSLMAIGIIAILIEIFAAGFGVAGIIGIACFALYFIGHLAAGYAGWATIIIFIIGIVLLLLEAFVVPGFGVTGIAGLVAIFGSIILTAQSFEVAMISVVVAIILSIVLIGISIKYGRTNKVWRKLILKDRTDKESGYHSMKQGYEKYIGMDGVAITPLRPAGTALIDGQRLDVVSEGNFIAKDASIRVVDVEGIRIIVKGK